MLCVSPQLAKKECTFRDRSSGRNVLPRRGFFSFYRALPPVTIVVVVVFIAIIIVMTEYSVRGWQKLCPNTGIASKSFEFYAINIIHDNNKICSWFSRLHVIREREKEEFVNFPHIQKVQIRSAICSCTDHMQKLEKIAQKRKRSPSIGIHSPKLQWIYRHKS